MNFYFSMLLFAVRSDKNLILLSTSPDPNKQGHTNRQSLCPSSGKPVSVRASSIQGVFCTFMASKQQDKKAL